MIGATSHSAGFAGLRRLLARAGRVALAASGLAVSAALFSGVAHAQGAKPTTATPEYRLGAGDVLRISVYLNADLTLETRVSEAGVVSYPLLGSVRLGSLTVTQAEKFIADGLRSGNFVKNPQVTIVVLQVKGNQASVLGQVNRPGRYPIETVDMRLTDLLANAGGVAPTGAEVVVVTGTRADKPFRIEVDLPSIFSDGGRAKDLVIENGDVVWVDRAPIVYIYGEVQRPGPQRIERGMTVLQALAGGGGLTARGTEKGIRVHRKNPEGKLEILQLAADAMIKDGDVVFVRESLF